MHKGHGQPDAMQPALRLRLCWALGGAWLAAFAGSFVFALSPVGTALGMVQSILLILILILHASLFCGWAGLGLYLIIGSLIGFIFEASSIATGFPFGSYVHNVPGPKVLGVTPMATLIYVIVGWFAWIVARAIVLDRPDRLQSTEHFTTPIVAAFILAGFDYPFDPIGATVQRLWTFTYPSGQYGVPISNYLGWLFTGWLLFQIMAAVEHRFRQNAAIEMRGFWLLPCLMWIAVALQYPIYWAAAPQGTITQGSSVFVIGDIYEASLAASLFTLIFSGALGVIRILRPDSSTPRGDDAN